MITAYPGTRSISTTEPLTSRASSLSLSLSLLLSCEADTATEAIPPETAQRELKGVQARSRDFSIWPLPAGGTLKALVFGREAVCTHNRALL